MVEQPPAWPAPPQPPGPPVPGRSPRRLVLAAAAGFAVAAVIALVLALIGALPAKAHGRPSGAAPALPQTFAGRVPYSQTQAQANPTAARNTRALDRSYITQTSAALRAAYEGAGVSVGLYYDTHTLARTAVWAVRAHTPPPVVLYTDLAYVKLAAPTQQITQLGPVYCAVSRQAVTAGSPVPPDQTFVSYCRRSSSSLTVWVYPFGTDPIVHRPAAVAALVNQMWQEVS